VVTTATGMSFSMSVTSLRRDMSSFLIVAKASSNMRSFGVSVSLWLLVMSFMRLSSSFG
jgi:hypothetical protein